MRWTVHPREPGRFLVELDDRLTPPGLALELEVLLVDGRSWALLVLSQTGEVVNVARAGRG